MNEEIKAFYNEKRVLVTGGAGFLGSNLVHSLVSAGAQVTVLDILEPIKEQDWEYDNSVNLDGVKEKIALVKGDIRNYETVSACVKGKDIIFHCAAHTSHPESMKLPKLSTEVNCLGSLNVLEAVRKENQNATVVYTGASTQVGKATKEVINETHPEFPRDMYSANKTAAEKYHLLYNYVHGLKTVVLRIANTYGPRATIHSPSFGFVNYFIGRALSDNDITIYGEGQQKRTVMFVDDVIRAMALAGMKENCIGETLFIANDKNYSVKELGESVVNVIGKGSVKNIPWPDERKNMEIGNVTIDISKAKTLLGWSPEWSLENGLAKTKAFYQDKLSLYMN